MRSTIHNTCLYVTGNCNSHCIFCYSPTFYIPSNVHNTSLSKFKKYVDIAIRIGSNSFVITGGEPLLYPSLFDLINYIKHNGCEVYLNTNAISFTNEIVKKIIENVDILGLPLESADYEINRKLGREQSYKKVTGFLEEYKRLSYGSKIRVKIATVATAINANSIPGLGKIIPSDIDLWKVYQFCTRGRGVENANKLSISDEKFRKLEKETREKNPNHRILFATSESIEESNFVVLPNGAVVTPSGTGYLNLGNISNTETQKKVQFIWRSDKYKNNACTYERRRDETPKL